MTAPAEKPNSFNAPIRTPGRNVLVAGTGLAGLTATLALAKAGFGVTLAGPDPAEGRPDRRTTALFGGSVALLGHLGVLERLAPRAAPLTGLRLVDDTGGILRAPEVLFEAHEIGRLAFGRNFENGELVEALRAAVLAEPVVTWRRSTVVRVHQQPAAAEVVLADDGRWTGRLVVGADGRRSAVRREAGIGVRQTPYPQTALVARFHHGRAHGGVSTEIYRRAGPLTTVPLAGDWSSLVWVETPAEAERLAGLADEAFRAELTAKLQGLLGPVGAIEHRAAFPLVHLAADAMVGPRTALIGEAAHVIPPIGAQGLNLSLRDIAWLTDITSTACRAGEDIGSEAVLARYRDARRGDIGTRTLAVDAINRSLFWGSLPADLLRGAGIAALAWLPSLRGLVMRQGLGPPGLVPPLLRE